MPEKGFFDSQIDSSTAVSPKDTSHNNTTKHKNEDNTTYSYVNARFVRMARMALKPSPTSWRKYRRQALALLGISVTYLPRCAMNKWARFFKDALA